MTGPAIVITIGVLFLLHQTHGGSLDFGNTWPVILVVIGFLYLASSLASRDGHIEIVSTPVPAPASAPPPSPQPPYSNQGNS
jgi:LiaI-LiaF-like transmembrane region